MISVINVFNCTHRDPRPAFVTIHYVPEFQDVSEVTNNVWMNSYVVRQAFASSDWVD